MYDPDVGGPAPDLAAVYAGAVSRGGVLDERQARQMRACYGGKLTMIDHWFGRVLDALDRSGLWDDTAVIVCTDHGHYLGEKDVWGKPALPVYEPLGHIPLMVALARRRGRDAHRALTTNVDVYATLLDVFGVRARAAHARPLARAARCAARRRRVRDWALSGVLGPRGARDRRARRSTRARRAARTRRSRCGRTAGRRCRSTACRELRLPLPDDRARLDRMPGSKVPVIRQPFGAGDRLPFWAMGALPRQPPLRPAPRIPPRTANLRRARRAEKRAEELLRAALVEIEAPDDQLARLGLA